MAEMFIALPDCERGQLLATAADMKIVKHLLKERMYLGKEDNISASFWATSALPIGSLYSY